MGSKGFRIFIRSGSKPLHCYDSPVFTSQVRPRGPYSRRCSLYSNGINSDGSDVYSGHLGRKLASEDILFFSP